MNSSVQLQQSAANVTQTGKVHLLQSIFNCRLKHIWCSSKYLGQQNKIKSVCVSDVNAAVCIGGVFHSSWTTKELEEHNTLTVRGKHHQRYPVNYKIKKTC